MENPYFRPLSEILAHPVRIDAVQAKYILSNMSDYETSDHHYVGISKNMNSVPYHLKIHEVLGALGEIIKGVRFGTFYKIEKHWKEHLERVASGEVKYFAVLV